ncbi:Ankyrin repeat-containing domain protein [Russula decolorans]
MFTSYRKCGASPLYYAALCGFQVLVQNLIVKYPQHANVDGGCYLTPLVAALAGKHFQTAELLRLSDADPNIQCYRGNTPLHSAACYGDVEMVQVLLNLEADINARNEHGEIQLDCTPAGPDPLYTTTYMRRLEVMRVLLERGANTFALGHVQRKKNSQHHSLGVTVFGSGTGRDASTWVGAVLGFNS